jgi:hypothetical protein
MLKFLGGPGLKFYSATGYPDLNFVYFLIPSSKCRENASNLVATIFHILSNAVEQYPCLS